MNSCACKSRWEPISEETCAPDVLANTWMRAPGESIGTFALESAMDERAHELQIIRSNFEESTKPEKDPT
jgi:xanthine dehydrogenase YagR molybdenum-binding subunit